MKTLPVLALTMLLSAAATPLYAESTPGAMPAAPAAPVSESVSPMPQMPCGRPMGARGPGSMMGPQGMRGPGPGMQRGGGRGMMNPQMKQGMMAAKQEHMKVMEQRLANIEALLKELVELQKK